MTGDARRELVQRAFAQHYDELCRLGYLMLGSPAAAEEIVMDVFTGTLRSWRSLGGPEGLLDYLRRGVVNRCRSHGSRRARERELYAEVAGRPVPPARQPDVETRDAVLEAVRALPPRQRAATVLAYYLDLSVDDVAATLGCSPGTVKSQLSKARASLAASLTDLEHDRA